MIPPIVPNLAAAVLNRRHLMALALMPVFPVARSPSLRAASESQSDEAMQLIAAGPDNGPLAAWAQIVQTVIKRLQPGELPLQVSHVGGADGVTAANQFEARTAPDGRTALLISGQPAIAWLVGDPRAQFDAGHWLPIATGLSSGVVLRQSPVQPKSGRLRLAVSGLSLLGMGAGEVTTMPDPAAALRQGLADVAFVHGPNAVEPARLAITHGASALFSLGSHDDDGNLVRDRQLPEVPTLPELMAALPPTPVSAALTTAWRATAAAAQVEFALLLPWLTPSGTVAWWRKAAAQIAQEIRAPDGTLQICTDPTQGFGVSDISVDAATSLALRRWLASHA
jgi:hypothetical protein